MAIKTKTTQATKKDTQAPAKKAPAKAAKPQEKAVEKKEAPKATTKPQAKEPVKAAPKPIITTKPQANTSSKTAYHVSKRDNDGREWKVFIQGSSKVIKLFNTQNEALAYAKSLCKNKDDGSYVVLHGLDGKIRRF